MRARALRPSADIWKCLCDVLCSEVCHHRKNGIREESCKQTSAQTISHTKLENDEFEGYPGINYENGREHLAYRVGSDEFFAVKRKETGKIRICRGVYEVLFN